MAALMRQAALSAARVANRGSRFAGARRQPSLADRRHPHVTCTHSRDAPERSGETASRLPGQPSSAALPNEFGEEGSALSPAVPSINDPCGSGSDSWSTRRLRSSLRGSCSTAGKLARRHVPTRLKAVSANRSAAIHVPTMAARIAEPWRPNRRLRNHARPARRLRKSTVESKCAMRRSPFADAVNGCDGLTGESSTSSNDLIGDFANIWNRPHRQGERTFVIASRNVCL